MPNHLDFSRGPVLKPTCTLVACGLHSLQPVQTVRKLCRPERLWRRAICRRSQLCFSAARASRSEAADVVVARRGKAPLLAPPPVGGARFADARSFVSQLLAHRALKPPTSSSLAEGKRLCLLLLRSAARDLPTLAALFLSCSRIAL